MKKTKKKKQHSILKALCMILIVTAVLMVAYRAIADGMIMINNDKKIPAEEDIPDIIHGEERTDVMLCYQSVSDATLMLVNLSHQETDIRPDEYPAEILEESGILPGDFAEITYTAEYTVGGENGLDASIITMRGGKQIFAKEALSKRTWQTQSDMWGISRTADGYPIQISQQEYADFVMIPAGSCYYLFTPDSDRPQIFDQYKEVTKEINAGDETKMLGIWVLCNNNMTDGAILDALYQGHVKDTPDLFFVGYDSPFPYQFTVNDYTQPFLYHINKTCISEEVPENCAFHLTPEAYADLSILPESIQQEVSVNWNHSDDILIFGGNYDEQTELTFDDNNRPVATSGNSQGYVIFYLQSGFFENICSGIGGE